MSIKYSRKEREWARQIGLIIGATDNPCLMMRRLERKGFKFLGKGAYKYVYHSRNFPGLVVKVYRYKECWKEDSRVGQLTKKGKTFFVTPLHHNRRYIIQKKVNRKGGTPDQAYLLLMKARAGRYNDDLGSHNCAFHSGKPYFFDYL